MKLLAKGLRAGIKCQLGETNSAIICTTAVSSLFHEGLQEDALIFIHGRANCMSQEGGILLAMVMLQSPPCPSEINPALETRR
eukprot:267637-Amphidinium_carterae.1